MMEAPLPGFGAPNLFCVCCLNGDVLKTSKGITDVLYYFRMM